MIHGDAAARKPRVLFAPHEIGGQMQVMAEELRRRGVFATAATYNQEWFGHVNDVHVDLNRAQGKLERHAKNLLFTVWAASNYDVFHFFWGESLYGCRWHPHLDLPLLRRLGKTILVHFRGLDLVDVAWFDWLRARSEGRAEPEPPISRPDQQRSLRHWRRYAHHLLVSEPDLLRLVPEAVLVQQAIELARWSSSTCEPRSREDGIIRIAHAPSLRRKKGTEFIEKAVADLQKRGHKVELVLIEKVPFEQVKALYEPCDIGVDQVLYGWYGKVSVELMALGKPVLCYIEEDLRQHRPDLPIVSAEPATLMSRLEELVRDPVRRERLGAEGRAYITRHHDVGAIMDQCLTLYRREE